jgi:hypothetical protein
MHGDLGAATTIGKKHKVVPYFKLPKKCKGGLPIKTEVVFGGQEGGSREFGIPAKTVTASFMAPCPA